MSVADKLNLTDDDLLAMLSDNTLLLLIIDGLVARGGVLTFKELHILSEMAERRNGHKRQGGRDEDTTPQV